MTTQAQIQDENVDLLIGVTGRSYIFPSDQSTTVGRPRAISMLIKAYQDLADITQEQAALIVEPIIRVSETVLEKTRNIAALENALADVKAELEKANERIRVLETCVVE